MEHCIFIPDPTEHCGNKDGALHHYSNLAQRIKENIKQLPPLYPESCIYRVHKRLRDVNPEAYTPIVISIGPYHYGKEGLYAMEEYKLRSLQSFLKRRELIDMEWYLSKLAELEDRARKFYADPIDLNSEEFVAMMLLDGCFIIEFLREGFPGRVEWVIGRDMILLENQLPYFVLSQLYDINKDSKNDEPLENMAKTFFAWLLPNSTLRLDGSNDTQEIKHLLHQLLVLCSPLSEEESTVSDIRSSCLRWPCCPFFLFLTQCIPKADNQGTNYCRDGWATNVNRGFRDFFQSAGTRTQDLSPPLEIVSLGPSAQPLDQPTSKTWQETEKQKSMARKIKSSVLFCPLFKPTISHDVYQIRSAVELRDAGVKFKKANGGIFDIMFENGLMEVPCFSVDDFTETLFRNLVAYEQHSVDDKPKYFTDYICFMDQLISSEKDVNLLRLKGIINNWLGDDQEVCKIFNRLGDGVTFNPPTSYYYSKVCDKVKEHSERPWNQKKAKLRHNYFNSPWAGISTLAAAVLLVLTLLQTIAAFSS